VRVNRDPAILRLLITREVLSVLPFRNDALVILRADGAKQVATTSFDVFCAK
jgi:hypothetical protein